MGNGSGRTSARRRAAGIAASAVALAVAAVPAAASASDYCVAPNTTCGGTNVATLHEALDQADEGPNADRIFLGATTYTAPAVSGYSYYRPDGPLEIVGASQVNTVITTPPGATGKVLRLFGGPGTSIHDLRVHLPANVAPGATGLQTNGAARRVTVADTGPQASYRIGVILNGGVLEDSVVGMGALATGVIFDDGGGGTIRHSGIYAAHGVSSPYGGLIERSGVQATAEGVFASRNVTTIRSSSIAVTAAPATGIRLSGSPGFDAKVVADGVDILADGGPGTIGARVSTEFAPADDSELVLTNSLLRGFAKALVAETGDSGSARVIASYSDYDGTGNSASGTNASISETVISNVGDVGFADFSEGNYWLVPGSPLIDAGDPTTAQGLDLRGNPLVADGDADGVARRDIGAYELMAPPAAGAPAGGGGSSGDVAPGGVTPGGTAADGVAPVVSGFGVTHSPFSLGRAATPTAALAPRGTRFRYLLSEPARVTITIQRRLAGGRAPMVGRLRRDGTAGANRLRFSGRIGRRALRPGSYRALIRAADAAGNRSARRAVRFRIVRG